jgi:putative addiction module component (TIGR02574 family)
MAAVDTLFEQALQLPEKERSNLVARLLQSLEPADDEGLTRKEWEEAWTDELDSRMRDASEDAAALVDGDAVFRDVEAIIRSHRP